MATKHLSTCKSDSANGAHVIRQPILVKQLASIDRRRVLKHFLALPESDRLMRFGVALSDQMVRTYVRKISFSRDIVFGVYDDSFHLIGVAHLALTIDTVDKFAANLGASGKIAELGISVLQPVRGAGIGSRLFERAIMHCQNNNITLLFMHCLSSNNAMMHIAKKAGMQIHRNLGEVDAYITLPSANPESVLQEQIEEKIASRDYALKANRFTAKWLDTDKAGN